MNSILLKFFALHLLVTFNTLRIQFSSIFILRYLFSLLLQNLSFMLFLCHSGICHYRFLLPYKAAGFRHVAITAIS